MPVLDGFGLLDRIRADQALSQLPVMMLTGHEDIRSIDRAFSLAPMRLLQSQSTGDC